MSDKILRVGTTYLPVNNVERSSEWYVNKLGAELSYKEEDKAILNFANQSFFLLNVKKIKVRTFMIVMVKNVFL